MDDINNILSEITKYKSEKDGLILAHNYQIPEVQDCADILGDSFALSKAAAETEKNTIVFCGVRFMAETAKILSPEKRVLLPVRDAGCPLADMIDVEQLMGLKQKYPDAAVVCYVNSSAEVKAESDICCTSSNAVKVVNSIEADEIIFVPDRNLAHYVQRHTNKRIIPWNGFCITHDRVKTQEILNVRELHPDAKVVVHPECKPEIVELADFVGSTSEITNYVSKDATNKFIIGTEMGVLHLLRKNNPNKEIYLLSHRLICTNMKKTKLADVLDALKLNRHEVILNQDIMNKAKKSLDAMLKVV